MKYMGGLIFGIIYALVIWWAYAAGGGVIFGSLWYSYWIFLLERISILAIFTIFMLGKIKF